MHLLGLNWQLQPADGHTFNNGIRTGLPGTDDVATMPSGGRGEITAKSFALSGLGNSSQAYLSVQLLIYVLHWGVCKNIYSGPLLSISVVR